MVKTQPPQKPKQTKQPDLSIVIPAYCEERRIGSTLDELAKFLEHDAFFERKDIEVIVVAADAPDRTHEIMAAKQKLFRHFVILKTGPRVGKGYDVKHGVLRACGKLVVFMDADLATPLRHMEEFYEACAGGYDVVVGTRDLLHYRSNRTRNLFSWFGNTLYRLAGGVHVEDTQCGFKMFSEEAAKLCFSNLTIQGWSFDMELLVIARANELKIEAYRINDWQDKPYSTYTDGGLRIMWRMMGDFMKIVRNQMSGRYVSEAKTESES